MLSSEQAGRALIAYYRQLLPICSLFWGATQSLGDKIDYAQQSHANLGELIAETLALLERRGGVNALINIKYMVPTYQSCC